MLAEKNISVFETTRDFGSEEPLTVVANDKGTTSWRIRKFPKDVRDLAELTAKNRGMKLADFLAEAIAMYGDHLDSERGAEADDGQDVGKALQDYATRIAALEERLAMTELAKTPRTPTLPGTKLKARIRVANLVDRPWLKNR